MASLITRVSELLHVHNIQLDDMSYASVARSTSATNSPSKDPELVSKKGSEGGKVQGLEEQLAKSLVFVDLFWPWIQTFIDYYVLVLIVYKALGIH